MKFVSGLIIEYAPAGSGCRGLGSGRTGAGTEQRLRRRVRSADLIVDHDGQSTKINFVALITEKIDAEYETKVA